MIFGLVILVSVIVLYLLNLESINQQNKLREKYNLLKEFYTYERIKRVVEDTGLILVMLKQTPKGHKFTVDLEGVDKI